MAKNQEILDVLAIGFTAGEALVEGQFVYLKAAGAAVGETLLAAGDNVVFALDADGDMPIGYTEFKAKIGDRVTVKTGNYAKRTYLASGIITRGSEIVALPTAGSVKTAAAADVVIGIATTSAGDGEEVEVIVYGVPVLKA